MSFSLKQIEFDRQIDLAQIREFRKIQKIEILNELYTKYMHLVYGVALKNSQSRDNAKEIVSKVFDLFKSEVEQKEIDDLRNWLYQTTVSVCSD